MRRPVDAIVVGGGQAGLASGYHLKRAGLSFAVFEADGAPGGSWPAYYDSLRLFSPANTKEPVAASPPRPIRGPWPVLGGKRCCGIPFP